MQSVTGEQVIVYYVDYYGNTSTVATTGVSAIPPGLVSQIPAHAMQYAVQTDWGQSPG